LLTTFEARLSNIVQLNLPARGLNVVGSTLARQFQILTVEANGKRGSPNFGFAELPKCRFPSRHRGVTV
jgi:hypothetical protein